MAQAINSPTARQEYALLVKFVMEILEILLLVALALVSSGIDLVAAATAEGLPGEAQVTHAGEPEQQAEAEESSKLPGLTEQTEQTGSADHQTGLPVGELPGLPELSGQAGQIGSATELLGGCGAGELPTAETVQPFSTALDALGNHPDIVQADNLDLVHGALDDAPAAVLKQADLDGLSNPELIAQAKAAQFPGASKWAKSRPLGKKTRVQVRAFLSAADQPVG